MADTHEERLLSGLLGDVAREDAQQHEDAAHLEARVLESASMQSTPAPGRRRLWMALPVAAAMVLAVATAVQLRPDAAPGHNRVGATTEAPKIVETPEPEPAQRQQHSPGLAVTRQAPPTRATDRAVEPVAQLPVADSAAGQPSVPEVAIEFVPLMPMTEHELSGSFQIVRVQMPSASLGPLRSPLAQANDIVEADVLLGEDGRARAIRVNNSNTSGSIYPWRPK